MQTAGRIRMFVESLNGVGHPPVSLTVDGRTFIDDVKEWKSYAHCYYGDYYPFTSYSLDDRDWVAWQYDRPDLGEGLVQVFRRAASPFVSAVFRLRGLDPKATYQFTSLDGGEQWEASGRGLMTEGLAVSLPEQPDDHRSRYRTCASGFCFEPGGPMG